ncbi:hypothetical protein BaRGS_00039300, partial [Batillaria attramentaria]
VLKASSSGLTNVSLERNVHLKELDLAFNNLGALALRRDDFPVLESVFLSSASLHNVSFVGLVHVREVDLSGNMLQSVALHENDLPSLQSLNLSSCSVSDVSLREFENLEVLDLSFNNLHNVSCLNLSGLHALAHLNLSHNPLLLRLDAQFQTLLTNTGSLSLQSVSLSRTGIEYIDVNPLAGMRNMVVLDITENAVRDVRQISFSGWVQLDTLVTDDFSVCCVYVSAFPLAPSRCRVTFERFLREFCIAVEDADNKTKSAMDGFSFQTPGCDVGWLSYQDSCFRFVFPIRNVSAITAENECREKFDAGLAVLPSEAFRNMTAQFLGTYGYRDLIVGLERVKTHVAGLSHLYRFLWQWTQAGTAFDGPKPEIQQYDMDCGALLVDSDGDLKAIDCSLETHDAYVCSKPNTERLPDYSPLVLTTPTVNLQLPTTECDDGSRVHTFHPCTAASETVRPFTSIFPLLHCDNGRRVHYTLTCDGFDDCGDKSDEKNCQDVRSDPLVTSSFMCTRQTELVVQSSRCNGMPDCHDGSDEENCDACSRDTVFVKSFGCLPQQYGPGFPASGSPGGRNRRDVSGRPALQMVNLDGYGSVSLQAVQVCPETHFRCKGGYCIPSFLLNNGQPDCPSSVTEDESGGGVTCSGHYRCYQPRVTSLQSLFLRDTGIEDIEENAFENLTSLLHVDIRENEIVRVNKLMFYGLTELEVLETDDPRLREEKRIQTMLAKLHVEMVAWPHVKLQELHAYCERLLVQVEASESQSARQVRGAERRGVSQEDHTFLSDSHLMTSAPQQIENRVSLPGQLSRYDLDSVSQTISGCFSRFYQNQAADLDLNPKPILEITSGKQKAIDAVFSLLERGDIDAETLLAISCNVNPRVAEKLMCSIL